MPANTSDSSNGCCETKQENKLVKISDLPLNGNPYPPRDVVNDETPGALAKAISRTRTRLQPYLTPICNAYERTSDFVSTGVAHSQSAFQSISNNQNALISGLTISGSTIIGLILSRRKGLFKKTLYATTFFTAASAFCYQDAARKNFDIVWVMAKNKLPELASSQYHKLSNHFSPGDTTKKAEGEKGD